MFGTLGLSSCGTDHFKVVVFNNAIGLIGGPRPVTEEKKNPPNMQILPPTIKYKKRKV